MTQKALGATHLESDGRQEDIAYNMISFCQGKQEEESCFYWRSLSVSMKQSKPFSIHIILRRSKFYK